MKKRKLRRVFYVLFMLIGLTAVIYASSLISEKILSAMEVDNNSYVLRDLVDSYLPVNEDTSDVDVVEKEEKLLEKPFTDDTVGVLITFYDQTSDAEIQEKSLILYERTYMPNTGVVYSSENEFDVVATQAGEVIDVKEDDIFGTIVTIKHNENIISKYSSLSNVTVKKGDKIETGSVVGKSGTNKAISNSKNTLLFELIYKDKFVNPEDYYNKNINELS